MLIYLSNEYEIYEKLNIYEVKYDQKTLCKLTKLSNQNLYWCLYIIFYYGINADKHLLIYPKIQYNTPFKMYADFIIQDRYEYYDFSYLRRNRGRLFIYTSCKKKRTASFC